MPEFTLYIGNKNYSSWSLRGWLAAKLAGIEFDEVLVRLDPEIASGPTQERLRAISPVGRVPVLKHGDRLIWDSLAIGEYLAELFPARELWPAALEARAVARSIVAEMHSGFGALRGRSPMNMRRDKLPPALDDNVLGDIVRIQKIWRNCREMHGSGGAYLFGRPTPMRFTRRSSAGSRPTACRSMRWRPPTATRCGRGRRSRLGAPTRFANRGSSPRTRSECS